MITDDQSLLTKLHYYSLPGQSTCVSYSDILLESYKFWHDSWGKTLKSLSGLKKLRSDEFFKFDEISFISHEDFGPVALHCHQWMDLSKDYYKDQAYLEWYPENLISSLEEEGFKKVLFYGNLIVHPEWRRSKCGLSFGDIITSFVVDRLQNTQLDCAITYTRDDRSVNKMIGRLGARVLQSDLVANGLPASIMMNTKDTAHLTTLKRERALTRELIKKRVEVPLEDKRRRLNRSLFNNRNFLADYQMN